MVTGVAQDEELWIIKKGIYSLHTRNKFNASFQAIGWGVIQYLRRQGWLLSSFPKLQPPTQFAISHPHTLSMNQGGNLEYLVRYFPTFAGNDFFMQNVFRSKALLVIKINGQLSGQKTACHTLPFSCQQTSYCH